MRPPGFTFCLFERQIVDMECRCSAMARFESSRSRPTVIPRRPTIFAVSAVLAPVRNRHLAVIRAGRSCTKRGWSRLGVLRLRIWIGRVGVGPFFLCDYPTSVRMIDECGRQCSCRERRWGGDFPCCVAPGLANSPVIQSQSSAGRQGLRTS